MTYFEYASVEDDEMSTLIYARLDDFILTLQSDCEAGGAVSKSTILRMISEVDPHKYLYWDKEAHRIKWFLERFNGFLDEHPKTEYRKLRLYKAAPMLGGSKSWVYRFADPESYGEYRRQHKNLRSYRHNITQDREMKEDIEYLINVKGVDPNSELIKAMEADRLSFQQDADKRRALLQRPVARKVVKIGK